MAERDASALVDGVKRTTSPRTTDGKRWEVQLSGSPSREWLELFKASGETANGAAPQRVEFDRASAVFKSDEDHVQHWIESIDRWIASTNARHVIGVERVRRERADRIDAEIREKARIQQLNDRFKDL
jgi:hypothetical protein